MKRNFLTLLFLTALSVLSLSSCQSKEKKALGLIDRYMRTVLIDYDSYQVNEIKITKAFSQPYMDDSIRAYAETMILAQKKYDKAYDDLDENMESMKLWTPILNSSSYAVARFTEASASAKANLKTMAECAETLTSAASDMKKRIESFEREFIGWGCTVNYRCRTAGGQLTLGLGYFVVDNHFKTLVYEVVDMDDDDFCDIVKIINEVKADVWDSDDPSDSDDTADSISDAS